MRAWLSLDGVLEGGLLAVPKMTLTHNAAISGGDRRHV
jgi:hypothetical protein